MRATLGVLIGLIVSAFAGLLSWWSFMLLAGGRWSEFPVPTSGMVAAGGFLLAAAAALSALALRWFSAWGLGTAAVCFAVFATTALVLSPDAINGNGNDADPVVVLNWERGGLTVVAVILVLLALLRMRRRERPAA